MKSYECTIFMGSVRHGSEGTRFSKQDVIEEIKYVQAMNSNRKVVVRVSDTTFVFLHYEEKGFKITAIQYPRFPQSEFVIKAFMRELADHLKGHFDQKSVSISDSKSITYLGDEDEHSS